MDESKAPGRRDGSTEPVEAGETPAGLRPVGRVGAPPDAEATSEHFHFWVPEDRLVEKTQLVHVESPTGGQDVRFYGLVTEVFRRSRRSDMLEEADRFDGRPEEHPRSLTPRALGVEGKGAAGRKKGKSPSLVQERRNPWYLSISEPTS